MLQEEGEEEKVVVEEEKMEVVDSGVDALYALEPITIRGLGDKWSMIGLQNFASSQPKTRYHAIQERNRNKRQ